ncbi:oxidoreductase [Sanguibacter sp. 25GB23B1]|uniref:oxidoreductase n=1 Tax=unclassified Sanguibacter TaxID=2645534 RepID=UPI0032AEEA2C
MSRLSRLFSRRTGRASDGSGQPDSESVRRRRTREHLAEFTATRVGVEAYIEPPTVDEPTSVLLIATTGEWTRRRVPDASTARSIARDLGIPVYDVNFTGYPQRMRDWNSAHRRRQRDRRPRED